jgi:hypothetical protein
MGSMEGRIEGMECSSDLSGYRHFPWRLTVTALPDELHWLARGTFCVAGPKHRWRLANLS